ncbi:glycosyltransferase [Chlorogloeopsis sp. ULAP01]|uniref:glycosyltransferase n=1 Tax=Chlorogloeopsis sp. ULAP01 TaxID=3056483 RepID=UPI0025AB30BC|nr:glycosyltransferase [Chlorogloeopsis sp. ULAP01]MDM9381130.1 glycosyltransferase [Chlorogloeopsis sp. ULAP01]
MNKSSKQEKVVSFLLITLDADGGNRATLSLAQGFVERGLAVDIIVLKAEGEALKWLPPKARLVELQCRNRGLYKFSYLLSLARYLRKVQPDALVTGDDINYGSMAKYLAGVRTQIVISSHTILSSFLENSPWRVRVSPTAFLLRNFLWFYGWADAIAPVSQGVADDLERMAGQPLKRMRVIYNPAVTPQLLEQAKEPIEHEWFVEGAPPVILGVGRLSQEKDFPTLIRALAIVRKQITARLMILGEGYERSRLEALIAELGLTSEVALPGFILNPYAYMSKAAVFVLSSTFEAFGLVLVEAMVCGTPVVSTDCVSGPSEILEGGKFGKLVPVGDEINMASAIISTLKYPTDIEALQQQAHKFSVENAVNGYLELINQY